MRRSVLATLLAAVLLLLATAGRVEAGCRPKPHGPYGGACYACGGPGFGRGYPVGYYGFGSWGYGPGYRLGNYGYGPGFGRDAAYSTQPGYPDVYAGPGYQSGYASGRQYKIVAYYYGSGGYLCRPVLPRDYGGEYGGILAPNVNAADSAPPEELQR